MNARPLRLIVLVLCTVTIDAHAKAAKTGDPCETSAPSSAPFLAFDMRQREFVQLHREFKQLVRAEPARALLLACAAGRAARDANQQLQARIDVGTALTNDSREAESLIVLDAAIATAESSHSIDRVIRGEAYLRRGQAYASRREQKQAEADFTVAHNAWQAGGAQESVLYAETLLSQSGVWNRTLDLVGAERAVDEADHVLKKLGMSGAREAGDVFNQRTMIAYARQDFPATIRYAESELDVIRSIGGPDDRELLDALATLGALKSITGDFAGAEAAMREGLRIAEVRNDTSIDARLGILQNFAVFYLDRAQPVDALPLAERALALAEQHYGPDAVAMMREHLTLAAVHADLARYSEARRDYVRAAAIDAAHGSSIDVLQRLRFYLRRAQLDLKLGDLEAVRTGIAEAERVMADRPRLGYWRGWSARLACKLDAIEENWRAADAHCADAMAQLGEVLDRAHVLIVESEVNRCIAQLRGRLPGDACDAVETRMRSAPVAHPKTRLIAFEAMSERERARGNADAALDLRVKALAAAEEIDAPDPLWAAHYGLAESLAEHGDRRLAIFFAKRSIEAIEDMRSHFAADRERLERGFLSDKLTVYRHLADWLLEESRAPEAIEVLRLLKREEMFDYVERNPERAAIDDPRARVPYSGSEASLARMFDRTGASGATGIAASSAEIERLVRLRDAKKISADEQARLQQLLSGSRRREEVRAVEVKRFIVEQQTATTASRDAAPPLDVRVGSNAALDNHEANAYFFLAGSRLQLILAWKGGIERRVVEVDARALNRSIGDYLAAVSAREDTDRARAATDLYAWLGSPLDREARTRGITRVHLWLDGALRYVPFAALWDGRNYLIERYEFSYLFAPPASIDTASSQDARHVVQSKSITVPHALIAFGVTRALGGMPALPGVGEELCGIVNGPVSGLQGDRVACAASGMARGELVGTGFANDYFTETRLREATSERQLQQASDEHAPRVDVLHVGTHFSLRPGNMQRSWMLLGDGARLPLASFQQLDFAGLDLVTLSACQTGMAGAVGDDGREIEGLPTLIHQRGARAVVASLWRIDDRSASELMRKFYAGLKRPHARIAEALRTAQLSMLRSAQGTRSRPYYWAAFVPSVAAP